MGKLFYDGRGEPLEIDDRTMLHLQAVIVAKLRRNEHFAFTWDPGLDGHFARLSIWVNPSTALVFGFDSTEQGPLNREWIEALMLAANSVVGLHLIPEPANEPERARPVPATT